ncbi:MAG TPA: DUF423 domain-containing protein [Burkholderiaceae bacterium]|nr:DUF423 domain-containing protein [Burkholderiaceae bacterium]
MSEPAKPPPPTALSHPSRPVLRLPARLVMLAGLLMLTGVMAGAWGTHGLRHAVVPGLADIWKTAVFYQLLHGVAIILVSVLSAWLSTRKILLWAAWLMLLATLMFSGSLYALVLTGRHWMPFLTPIGGLCFLISWALVIIGAWGARHDANISL